MPFMCYDEGPSPEELAKEQAKIMQERQRELNEMRCAETVLWEAHTLNSSFSRLPRSAVILISAFCGRDQVIARRVEKGFSLVDSFLHLKFGTTGVSETAFASAAAYVLDYDPALHELSIELESGHKIALPIEEAACKKALQGGQMKYMKKRSLEGQSWPKSYEQATPSWLAHQLGLPPALVSVARVIPEVDGKTSRNAKIELATPVSTEISSGLSFSVKSVFLKVPSLESIPRDIRLAFMREIYWYTKLSPSLPAACRSVSPIQIATSTRHEDLGLLLEDVSNPDNFSHFVVEDASKMRTTKQCYSAAEALALLHAGGKCKSKDSFGKAGCRSAFFSEEMALPKRPLPLCRLSAAAELLTSEGHISTKVSKGLVEAGKNQWLIAAMQYCKSLPHTLLHCDTRPAHIFFRCPMGDACFVDWQRCGYGPCAADICNLLCFCAKPGQLKDASLEETVIDAYLRAWDFNLSEPPSRVSLHEEYKVCLALHVAFLGGAAAFAVGDKTHVIAALRNAAAAAERLDVFRSASVICAGQINQILHKKSSLLSSNLKIRASLISATFYTCASTYHTNTACEKISGSVRRISGLEAGASKLAACSHCRAPFVLEKPCKFGNSCLNCPALRPRQVPPRQVPDPTRPVALQCRCTHPGEELLELAKVLAKQNIGQSGSEKTVDRHSHMSKTQLEALINANLKSKSGGNAAISTTSRNELEALLNERLRTSRQK